MRWVGVLQYKSLGVGTALTYDKVNDMAEFVLQKAVDASPAGAIYGTVQMAHACGPSGLTRCFKSSAREAGAWKHAYDRNRTFLRNGNILVREG